MEYIDEGLEGEAPCEFCGQLYPLVLLIEHQSIHLLDEDEYPFFDDIINPDEVQNIIAETAGVENKSTHLLNEDEYPFFDDIINPYEAQNIIAETAGVEKKSEVIVEQNQQSAVRSEPEKIVEQIQQSAVKNESKASEENIKAEQKRSSPENSHEISVIQVHKRLRILSSSCSSREINKDFGRERPVDVDSEDDVTFVAEIKPSSENITIEEKQNLLLNKTLKDIKKFPEQKGKEFITEKGEKLFVYGDEIDPDKEMDNEKPAYKMPDNPLLSSMCKNEDVEDINNLSDDECSESLEEFWKKARDFLKRNRGKSEC